MKFWVMIWQPKTLNWKAQIIEASSHKDILYKLQELPFLEGLQRVDFRNKIRDNISRRDYRKNLTQTIGRIPETQAERIVLSLCNHKDNYMGVAGGPWLQEPWWPYQDLGWEGTKTVSFI